MCEHHSHGVFRRSGKEMEGSKEPARFRHLFTKEQLESEILAERLTGWRAETYHQFKDHVLDSKFPCPFARQAQLKGQLTYGFNDLVSDKTLDDFCEGLSEFIAYVKALPEREQLYEVLIAFFKTDGASLYDHHSRAWSILQQMIDDDPNAWPSDIPRDPEDPAWSFSFNATPLFINVNSGYQVNRQSRNLGADLVLVIQFRDGFDHLPGDAKALREIIRARIDKYDRIPRAPVLGSYGDSSAREYLQYALAESNEELLPRCPLKIPDITEKLAA
jgi:FPC/CPF motif-containing protein YcgG